MSASTATNGRQNASNRKQSASSSGRVRAKRGNASITINRNERTKQPVSLRLRWRWPEDIKESLGRGKVFGHLVFDLEEQNLAQTWKQRFDGWGIQVAYEAYLAEQKLVHGFDPAASDPAPASGPAVPLPRTGIIIPAQSGERVPAAEPAVPLVPTVERLVKAYLKAGGKYGVAGDGHLGKEQRRAIRHVFEPPVTVELEDGSSWLIPRLGSLPLEELTREVILAWIDVLAATPLYRGTSRESTETLGGKTMKDIHALLSAAIEWGLIHKPGWIAANPARSVKTPKTPKLPMVIVMQDQLRLILRTIDPRYVDLVMVLVGTGMRWSEATALERQDVRVLPDGGIDVHVRQAWKDQASGPQKKGVPKSERGDRHINLKPTAAAVPAIRRAIEGKKAKAALFTSPLGFQLRNGEFHDRVWGPLREKLLPAWNGRFPRVHDLRHTFASVMIAGGTDIAAVSTLLGHEKVSFTYDTYVHLIPGGKDKGMDCVDAWLQDVLTKSVPYEEYSREQWLSEDDAA